MGPAGAVVIAGYYFAIGGRIRQIATTHLSIVHFAADESREARKARRTCASTFIAAGITCLSGRW